MRALLVMVALGVVGCDGGSTIPDGPVGEAGTPPRARCQQLVDEIADALQPPGTCESANDCTVVGGQRDFPTCNCAPFVLDCSGVAVERDRPGLAAATQKIATYWDLGCGDGPDVPAICDCAPLVRLACVNGRCRGEADSCLVPPDAAIPPDAFIPDAS